MIIFGGSAGEALAVRVANLTGAKLGKIDQKRFPDGEKYFRVLDDVKGDDVVIIHPTGGRPDELIIEYLMLVDTLKDMAPKSISAVFPYFAYARQDARFNPGEPLSFHLITRLIEQIGTHKVYTIDLHLQRITDMGEIFKIPARNLTAVPYIAEYISKIYSPKNAAVIGPDMESEQWAKVAAAKINTDYAVLEKTRFSATDVKIRARGGEALNVQGRDAIIIDDIISTGNTIIEAAQVVKQAGANRIYVGCTHPVLSGNALSKMYAAGIEAVVGTDTFPGPVSFVSVAPVIAEALKKVT
ncbi:MAG: ribose-phosphate diphosphokinase [Thaumarchaeota archaeon]|nr:ribose-phosphate diphosphokinase [Nitrososphaerota archaeon]